MAATGLFLWVLVLGVCSGVRQFRAHRQWTLQKERKSTYEVALRSLCYVLGVKLVIMIVAQILYGQVNLFADAQALWCRSDAPHYLSIAKNWYVTTGDDKVFIAFFPLYPIVLRIFAEITGEYFWTGSVISMACLTVAGVLLYRLAEMDHGSKAAGRTLKYFMLFPAIFFGFFPFSESLFLMLAASVLYFLRKKNYLAAALLGALASFTRSVGVLLMVPFAVQVAQDVFRKRIDWQFIKDLFRKGWSIFLVPVGTLGYLGINWAIYGSPFHFLAVQKEHWYQGIGTLPDTVRYTAENIFRYEPAVGASLFAPNLIVIFAFLAVMLLCVKRQRSMDTAYMVFLFYFSISLTWLLSAPRYMLVMFPCFIEMGRRVQSKAGDWILTAVLAVSLLCFSAAFAGGCSIY